MKILFAFLFSIQIFASDMSYRLLLNKVVNDCQVFVYGDYGSDSFAILNMAHKTIKGSDFYKKNREDFIKDRAQKFSLKKILGDGTSDHIFFVKDNEVRVKFKRTNKLGKMKMVQTTLFKNLRCTK